MKDPKRREMFTDLYRLAEYYEDPPLGSDIRVNAEWFTKAMEEQLKPFLKKWDGDQLAGDMAIAILDEASRLELAARKETAGVL